MKRTKSQIYSAIRSNMGSFHLNWASIFAPKVVKTTGLYARPSGSHAGQVYLYLRDVDTNGIYVTAASALALGQQLVDAANVASEFALANAKKQVITVTLQNGSEIEVPVPASANGQVAKVRLA